MSVKRRQNCPFYVVEGALMPDRPRLSCDLEDCITMMEKGQRIIKVRGNKLTDFSSRIMSLRRETRQIILRKTEVTSNNTKSVRQKTRTIDINTIREIACLEQKTNHNLRLSDMWRKNSDLTNFHSSRFLLIWYGDQFVMSFLFCMFENSEYCRNWIDGLTCLVHDNFFAPYPMRVDRWLRRQFHALESPIGCGYICVKELKQFLKKVHYQVDSKQFRELVHKAVERNGNRSHNITDAMFGLKEKLCFEAFASIYRSVVYDHAIFSDNFSAFCEDGSTISLDRFQTFLSLNQQELIPVDNKYFLSSRIESGDLINDNLSYTREEFMDYLFSRHNTIWDPENDAVGQDMNQPLCNYFIASSHNTYLTGDQLKSDSTLDAYARSLLQGCRCIELDCWDGTAGPPYQIIIFHGYTLTSRLEFPDVLRTIREYAFVTSEYPVILSIEDNCTLPFQRQMALYFQEIFGDMLLTMPVDSEANQLPSPEQLKRRIILKHKKLPRESDIATSPAANSFSMSSTSSLDDSCNEQENVLSHPDTQKRGVLHMRNERTGVWSPHIFVLTCDRLLYSEDTNLLMSSQPASVLPSLRRDSTLSTDVSITGSMWEEEPESEETAVVGEDMHVSEVWYHGRIKRDEAGRQLRKHAHLGDGLFLVRTSELFPGDYSLSFLHQGDVHHCRVRSTQVGGEKKYYFHENRQMDTLFELISYYQEHTLSTPRFAAHLRTPCPQPSPHVGQPWFVGDMSRTRAEELLNSNSMDGAFLVRKSQANTNAFTLSFRADALIKHCRLKQEGRLFVIGAQQFENLVNLVDFFSKTPLYHGVPLKFPVNANSPNCYAHSMASGCEPGSYMYMDAGREVRVMAKYPYEGHSHDELSFPANAVIKIISKADENWWMGEYNGRRGSLPASYVEQLSDDGVVQAAISGESKPLGYMFLAGCQVERIARNDCGREFAFCVRGMDSQVIVSAQSKDDQDDWINSVTDLSSNASRLMASVKRKESQMRIATELSNLVVYCQAVPFCPERIPGNYWEMCSFNDSKLDRFVERGLVRFNQYQISRVYPNASRLASGNFNPVPAWNAGCQMVALNYQTPDKPMQLNHGKFLANGRAGYVLKPAYMRTELYDPLDNTSLVGNRPLTLTIQVIAGRHLFRRDRSKGTVCPYVEIEVISLDYLNKRTSSAVYNGLNPMWNQTFEFNVACPEIALIRFLVQDEDFLGADPFIGQAVYPVNCIRAGFRSVPLKNEFSELLELSALLVHVDKRVQNADEMSCVTSLSSSTRSMHAAPANGHATRSLPAEFKQLTTEQRLAEERHVIHRRLDHMNRAETQSDADKPQKGSSLKGAIAKNWKKFTR